MGHQAVQAIISLKRLRAVTMLSLYFNVLQVPEELRGASRLYGVPYPFLDAVI